jgi:hypothetical protein
MHDVGKTIGTIANIGIILATMMVGFIFVKNYILKPANSIGGRDIVKLIGAKLPMPDVNWTKNSQTLLFVLQKGCRYCADSALFYQRIAGDEKIKSKTQLIAVFPHSTVEGAEYLKQLSIPISEIKEIPLNDLGVRGTPTLLLVDSSGVVKNIWRGKLSANRENEVFNKLQ